MAFHPYPQLIPYLFNGSGFGPPAGVTQPSSWPWVDHLVSGLHPATESPCSDSLSLRLPYAVKLATECKSLTHYTKGTQSPLLQTPSGCSRRAARRFSLTLESSVTPHLETDMTSVSLLLNTFESHRYAMRLERTSKALEAGAPTVCMHAVSGSVSLPSRGSFRLSLTVLVHYRSITSI